MLSYEVIEKAASVESEAVNVVLLYYAGYIKYLSYFHECINDNIQDPLKALLMVALSKFRFDG